MAILGLVFAFVFSPLGIVFSAIGLKQVKERREGGRGLALAGLILSIVFVILGIIAAVLFVTVVSAAVEEAAGNTAAEAPAGSADPGAPAEDPTGVVAACEVIVPAGYDLEAERSAATTSEEYAAVIGELRSTIEAAAAGTADPVFIADVQTLSGDLQQVSDAVDAAEDASALEAALTEHGTAIDDDCAAAGYVE